MEYLGIIKKRRNEYGKSIRKLYEKKLIKERWKNIKSWIITKQNYSDTLTSSQMENLMVFKDYIKGEK